MSISLTTHEGREGRSVGEYPLAKAVHCALPILQVCNDIIGS